MNGAIFPVVNLERIWGSAAFKPSPYYVLAVIGFGFLTIGFVQFIIDKSNRVKGFIEKNFLVYYGRAILWVYIFSTIFGYKMTLLISFFNK